MPPPNPPIITLTLPPLDDATAVVLYNFLADLVDRFDFYYGEQICRFYANECPPSASPPHRQPDDIPPS